MKQASLYTLTVCLCLLLSNPGHHFGASPENPSEQPPVGSPSALFPELAQFTEDGFEVPQPGHHFTFPRDHGSHPAFKLEWWYLTGHLFGPNQERFGFQATIFRKSGKPPSQPINESRNRFQKEEFFLVHTALLNTLSGEFLHTERLARAGWDASASTETLSLHMGDFQLVLSDPTLNKITLDAHIRDQATFSLSLEPLKPLVVFGENGISRKGNSPTAASWYLTFPRLKTTGTLTLQNKSIPVTGEVWMDHEISSSQLTAQQVGWDWAGIQLDDGREIMVYRLRLKDGSPDPASALSWVDREGHAIMQPASAFSWDGKGVWKSPHSGAAYPLPVQLKATDPATGLHVEFILAPLVQDQELQGTFSDVPYWEGACRVLQNGKPVGSAYVELTGYSGSLTRALR
jgi:predicted secreted hydrolase